MKRIPHATAQFTTIRTHDPSFRGKESPSRFPLFPAVPLPVQQGANPRVDGRGWGVERAGCFVEGTECAGFVDEGDNARVTCGKGEGEEGEGE